MEVRVIKTFCLLIDDSSWYFVLFLDPVVYMYFAPDGDGNYVRAPSRSLFLWGQSLFIIAQLLTAGLLHINELDPIRRYLPSYNRPRKGGRYSAFQVSYS